MSIEAKAKATGPRPVTAPRLIIAGTGTGTGKTAVTCGLARLLTRRGRRVAVCKCGPDYLDPTLLAAAAHATPANLDLYLADGACVRALLARRADPADVTLIEGVMGLFDGIGTSEAASSAAVAAATDTPVILVLDARSRALSLAAELLGHLSLRRPTPIQGAILNRVSAKRYPALRDMLERECGIPCLGFVPTMDEAAFESRHLGLVPARELADLDGTLDLLAQRLAATLEVDRILEVARQAASLVAETGWRAPDAPGACGPASGHATDAGSCPRTTIAVATDEAFCFTYPETLEALRSLGATIAPFSPIHDTALPAGAAGLVLPGGYPELHAAALAANAAMRGAVRRAIEDGMPTVAECGGYLYLLEALADPDGREHEMVGALPGRARRGGRLAHFGYARVAPAADSLLAERGHVLLAHEFHHWQTDVEGTGLEVVRARDGATWSEGFVSETLYAGFPHLYLAGDERAARRLVDACRAYAARHAMGANDAEAGDAHA